MSELIRLAEDVFDSEIDGLKTVKGMIDRNFELAVQLLQKTHGRVVVIGMGKSGLIGRKIAATLASTGTPSIFVHPAEAFHGDLGMIQPGDSTIMISYSGETEELIRLIPYLKSQNIEMVLLTGNPKSILGEHVGVVLSIRIPKEACNNNLAPTTSTTAALVMGDAIAIALSTLKKFEPHDFARFHPGGNLGKRLLYKVSDVMSKDNLPICEPNRAMHDVVVKISESKLGVVIVSDGQKMLGIISDGDLRRALIDHREPLKLKASEIMTANPIIIYEDEPLIEAEKKMLEFKKRMLVVLDRKEKPVGVVQIFDV